jgi:hypothetical protein
MSNIRVFNMQKYCSLGCKKTREQDLTQGTALWTATLHLARQVRHSAPPVEMADEETRFVIWHRTLPASVSADKAKNRNVTKVPVFIQAVNVNDFCKTNCHFRLNNSLLTGRQPHRKDDGLS